LQLELPPFTLIAATTRISLLSSPLRSRFSGGIFRLEFYKEEEIEQILKRSSALLGVNIEEGAIREIAKRSRFTPRAANHFLKRCRDYAQVHKKSLSAEIAREALKMQGIDEIGLGQSDLQILEVIIDKYGGGPVGLNTIGATLSEDPGTIEEFNEPYLIQLGMIDRTPRGRIATARAYEHLGKEKPTLL
jgi:Holliday junction DNA helicase RuvB